MNQIVKTDIMIINFRQLMYSKFRLHLKLILLKIFADFKIIDNTYSLVSMGISFYINLFGTFFYLFIMINL